MAATPPRPRPGDRVRASDAVRRDEAIRAGQVRSGEGYTVARGTKGTSVRVDATDRGGWIAVTGPLGVPAMVGLTPGSATVTRYRFGTASLVAAGDIVVYNIAPAAVGGDKLIMGGYKDGKRVVDWEWCDLGA